MKKLLSIFLIALLTFTSNAFAAAAPSRIQSSVSNVIQYKLQQRGFAANDPIIGTTLTSVSGALGAAAVASGAIAAFPTPATPVWAAVGAVLGVASLVVGGVAWYMTPDGQVTMPGNPGSPGTPYNGITWVNGMSGYWPVNGLTGWLCFGCVQGTGVSMQYSYMTVGDQFSTLAGVGSVGGIQVFTEYMANNSVNSNTTAPTAPITTTATGAWSQIGSTALSQPLDNQFIADLANKAMIAAANQAGYAGVAPQTITAADVATAQATSPSAAPTLADALAPQAAPAGSPATEPFALPAANPVANTAPGTAPLPSTNPVTAPVLDWGIPNDGSMIPTKNVAVSYTPTIFSTASGCPAPISFPMFGKTYFISWEPMCNLMTTVSIIFLALGAAAAALIFAEAFKPS